MHALLLRHLSILSRQTVILSQRFTKPLLCGQWKLGVINMKVLYLGGGGGSRLLPLTGGLLFGVEISPLGWRLPHLVLHTYSGLHN
jgi:hypothetical protein